MSARFFLIVLLFSLPSRVPFRRELADEQLAMVLDDPIQTCIEPFPGVEGSIPNRSLLDHICDLAKVVESPDSPFLNLYDLIEFERW